MQLLQVKRIMIVDLDAHQGNGYEHDCKDNASVYIFDAYNKWIYPRDYEAEKAISKKLQLDFYTEDEEYLSLVSRWSHCIKYQLTANFVHYFFVGI